MRSIEKSMTSESDSESDSPAFPFGSYEMADMEALLKEAKADPEIKGEIFCEDLVRPRLPIFFEEKLVGFATPVKEPDGVWNIGTIYIMKDFRGRGLGRLAIRTFMTKRRGRIFIDEENVAGRHVFKAAGFRAVRSASGGRWWENF